MQFTVNVTPQDVLDIFSMIAGSSMGLNDDSSKIDRSESQEAFVNSGKKVLSNTKKETETLRKKISSEEIIQPPIYKSNIGEVWDSKIHAKNSKVGGGILTAKGSFRKKRGMKNKVTNAPWTSKDKKAEKNNGASEAVFDPDFFIGEINKLEDIVEVDKLINNSKESVVLLSSENIRKIKSDHAKALIERMIKDAS